MLYHHLFSSQAAGFLSEPAETQAALASVQAALAAHPGEVTHLVDRGFDDDEVRGRIWAAEQHVVGRVFHFGRLVEAPAAGGAWGRMPLAAAAERVRPVADLTAEMLVRKRGQRREKRPAVAVRLAASPVRIPYRAPGAPRYPSARRWQAAWLVRVEVLDVEAEPWWLLTDWPVEDAAGALRVFRMYRQRWAAEDAFKFAKKTFGWEDVQLMGLADVQTLSALGWVAAAFLYELGVGLDGPAVRLLVRLAGGELRANRPPGKAVLTRGLRRLLDHFVTDAFLRRERGRGPLPPQIAAFLHDYAQPP